MQIKHETTVKQIRELLSKYKASTPLSEIPETEWKNIINKTTIIKKGKK